MAEPSATRPGEERPHADLTITERAARDVERALAWVDGFLADLPEGSRRIANREILVLDAGVSRAEAVLLACLGARVTSVSPHAATWDHSYHGLVFNTLQERLRRDRREFDPRPLWRILGAQAFAPETVRAETLDLVHLTGLSELELGTYDLVLSDAVLDRVERVPDALDTLAGVMRQGALGVHRLHFKDSRAGEQPLEMLTLPVESFTEVFRETGGACGNRWRPCALQEEALRAEFDVVDFLEGEQADDATLDDVLPRLHDDFQGLDRRTLRTLSGTLILRRRGEYNTEYPTEDDAEQTLAHSRCRYASALPHVPGRRVLDVGCGAGLGTRDLIAAGAAEVVGIDRRPEALALASDADDREPAGEWVEHDLERGLPFPDGRFDVVVALEVIEHVREQQHLVDEIRRVLAPDGVALLSVPHLPFEQFWTDLAGEENPYHLHVPDRAEFRQMLAGFADVRLSAQVDMVASVVLPAGHDGEEHVVIPGTIRLPDHTQIADHGTGVLIATAYLTEPETEPQGVPQVHAWGDHQSRYGDAMHQNQLLARYADTLLRERNEALARLHWLELEARDPVPSGEDEGERPEDDSEQTPSTPT
jgi:SAM-dependent methyltransferase